MHKSSIRGLSLLLAPVVLAILTNLCLANGQHDHGQKNEKSAHMEAMYALREKVPEDYRIMERTPVVADQDSLQIGEELFLQQCAVCHGQEGQGDGPAAKGLNPKPANFLDREHSSIYGPGEKFWIIGNGSGETGMPAFPHLGLVDRWHLVNHIYELQGAKVKEDGHKHHH